SMRNCHSASGPPVNENQPLSGVPSLESHRPCQLEVPVDSNSSECPDNATPTLTPCWPLSISTQGTSRLPALSNRSNSVTHPRAGSFQLRTAAVPPEGSIPIHDEGRSAVIESCCTIMTLLSSWPSCDQLIRKLLSLRP